MLKEITPAALLELERSSVQQMYGLPNMTQQSKGCVVDFYYEDDWGLFGNNSDTIVVYSKGGDALAVIERVNVRKMNWFQIRKIKKSASTQMRVFHAMSSCNYCVVRQRDFLDFVFYEVPV